MFQVETAIDKNVKDGNMGTDSSSNSSPGKLPEEELVKLRMAMRARQKAAMVILYIVMDVLDAVLVPVMLVVF